MHFKLEIGSDAVFFYQSKLCFIGSGYY